MSHSWSSSESFETGETDQECDPFFSEYFYQQRRQNSIDGYVTDASDHFTIDPRSPQFDAGQLRELPSERSFNHPYYLRHSDHESGGAGRDRSMARESRMTPTLHSESPSLQTRRQSSLTPKRIRKRNSQTFACPVFQHYKLLGHKPPCDGDLAENMSAVRRHLERNHKIIVKLCKICNEDIIHQQNYDTHAKGCSNKQRQRRGDTSETQWIALYRKLYPTAQSTPSPYNGIRPSNHLRLDPPVLESRLTSPSMVNDQGSPHHALYEANLSRHLIGFDDVPGHTSARDNMPKIRLWETETNDSLHPQLDGLYRRSQSFIQSLDTELSSVIPEHQQKRAKYLVRSNLVSQLNTMYPEIAEQTSGSMSPFPHQNEQNDASVAPIADQPDFYIVPSSETMELDEYPQSSICSPVPKPKNISPIQTPIGESVNDDPWSPMNPRASLHSNHLWQSSAGEPSRVHSNKHFSQATHNKSFSNFFHASDSYHQRLPADHGDLNRMESGDIIDPGSSTITQTQTTIPVQPELQIFEMDLPDRRSPDQYMDVASPIGSASPGPASPCASSPTLSELPDELPDVLECTFEGCHTQFTGDYRKGNLARHKRQRHGRHGSAVQVPCEVHGCGRVFKRKDARLKHYRKHHPHLTQGPALPRKPIQSSAFEKQYQDLRSASDWAS